MGSNDFPNGELTKHFAPFMNEETPGEKTNPPGSLGDAISPFSFHYPNICGLKTLITLGNFKFHFIPLAKGLKSLCTNGGIVNKYVIPIFLSNEPVALL